VSKEDKKPAVVVELRLSELSPQGTNYFVIEQHKDGAADLVQNNYLDH
jgi:hypothetical protein